MPSARQGAAGEEESPVESRVLSLDTTGGSGLRRLRRRATLSSLTDGCLDSSSLAPSPSEAASLTGENLTALSPSGSRDTPRGCEKLQSAAHPSTSASEASRSAAGPCAFRSAPRKKGSLGGGTEPRREASLPERRLSAALAVLSQQSAASTGVSSQKKRRLSDSSSIGGESLAGGGGGASAASTSALGEACALSASAVRTRHRNWRSNSMLLYNLVATHTLEWPTLSVQWPDKRRVERSSEEAVQRLLLTTHTGGAGPNALLLMEVALPVGPIDPSGLHYEQRQDYQGFEFGEEDSRKFLVSHRIPFDGECNKACASPFKESLIAAKALDGSVYLFEAAKFDVSRGEGAAEASAELVLTGHEGQGWGLEWSVSQEGLLASAGDDGVVCVWDTLGTSKNAGGGKTAPLITLSADAKRRPLQDVGWKNAEQGGVLVAVGDDGCINIWDIRVGPSPVSRTKASSLSLTCVSLNAIAPNVFATGGADAALSVWDFRDMRRAAHRLLQLRGDSITSVKWNPSYKTILAAGCTDSYVRIFDCSLIGAELSPQEAESGGPPELIFLHGGHLAAVSDFDWNPLQDSCQWMVASAATDNALQIWQPCLHAFHEDANAFLPHDATLEELDEL